MTQAVAIAQSGINNVTMRNRIINGAMMIDQRNAGASVTPTNGQYTLDRWQASADAASKYSVQQVTDAPSTFSFSAKITSLSAYSVGAAETFGFTQLIEGFNTADLKFGTSSAQAVTLSFWVKSSLTGTFGGSLLNSDLNRSYPFSYTISSANTWTQVSVTVTGDTTGTWVGATNGVGLRVYFSLGSGTSRSGTAGTWTATQYIFGVTGATSVVGTNGATFYITGVQLEAGTAATPFENRLYGTELMLCQRYFELAGGNVAAYCQAGNAGKFVIKYIVEKRSTPTLTTVASQWYAQNPAATFASGSNAYVSSVGVPGVITSYSSGTQTSAIDYTGTNNTGWTGMVFLFNAWIKADAEL